MSLADFELYFYYTVLVVSVISTVLQGRIVQNLYRDVKVTTRGMNKGRVYLAKTILYSEAFILWVHFAFMFIIGFPLLVEHVHWLATWPMLLLFLIEGIPAFSIPGVLLAHTYSTRWRREALADYLEKIRTKGLAAK